MQDDAIESLLRHTLSPSSYQLGIVVLYKCVALRIWESRQIAAEDDIIAGNIWRLFQQEPATPFYKSSAEHLQHIPDRGREV